MCLDVIKYYTDFNTKRYYFYFTSFLFSFASFLFEMSFIIILPALEDAFTYICNVEDTNVSQYKTSIPPFFQRILYFTKVILNIIKYVFIIL